MTGKEFTNARKWLGWTIQTSADSLEISLRTVERYANCRRIPRHIEREIRRLLVVESILRGEAT